MTPRTTPVGADNGSRADGDPQTPLHVLLATQFPPSYIEDTIVPKLRDLGILVARVVPVDYAGAFPAAVGAVLFMFQMTSHSAQDNLKARCKVAGVPFVLLERQSANWRYALTKAGLRFSGAPVPSPLPVAVAPAPPARSPETLPDVAPPSEEAPVPAVATFGEALRLAREADGQPQEAVAFTVGVSQKTISMAENNQPMQQHTYDALVQLYPALASAPLPVFGRQMKPRANGHAALPVTTIAPVELPVPPVATNGHKVTPPPLAGLLRAARAIGITGKLTVEVDDAESIVRVGAEVWRGDTADAAVANAKAALQTRLAEAMQRMEEARAMLAGGAS